jgi:hypothetical protein
MIKSKVAISNKLEGKWNIFEMLSYIFTISLTPQSLPSPAASVKPVCAPNGICTAPNPKKSL